MKCIWQMDGDNVKGFKCDFRPIDMLIVISGLKYITADTERHPKDRERAKNIYNQIMLGRYGDEAEQAEPQTDCGDFADRLAYERGVKHAWEVAQKVFDSTVTFYEAEDVAKQMYKDINVHNKDEPKTQMKTQNSNLTFEIESVETMSCQECKHYRVGKPCEPFLNESDCRYEPKTEPQTERSE